MRELYRLVLVDTPLAPYFSECITSEVCEPQKPSEPRKRRCWFCSFSWRFELEVLLPALVQKSQFKGRGVPTDDDLYMCFFFQDLDDMNIEIMRNTLYKAYLEDFYKFCQVRTPLIESGIYSVTVKRRFTILIHPKTMFPIAKMVFRVP